MSVKTTLARGRQVRRLLMRSEVRIERPNDSHSFNSETGFYEDGEALVIYEGPCHFKSWSPMGFRNANASGRELVTTTYEVILPFEDATAAVGISDTCTITASTDSWVIGRPLPVLNVEYSDDRTGRHLTVVELDRGTVDHA